MNELKNTSLWAIPFFTICGGIYHLAYWDTFDINGLAYIDLSEIIKVFIYPFVSAIIMFTIGIIIGKFIMPSTFFPNGNGSNTKVGKVLNSKWCIQLLIFIWAIVIYVLYNGISIHRWIVWGYIVGYVPWLYLNKTGFLHDYFKNERIRISFLIVLIYLPIYSFSTGKYNSELIKKNLKYEYITELKTNSDVGRVDSLKLLGYTGKFYIISNLNNDNLLIIESSKIEYIKLRQKK
jgi:hypothetical protein